MNIETFRSYCLKKQATGEKMPFGPEVVVFYVLDKMFALANLVRSPLAVNLKCDPDRVPDLRERYPDILPGYHMNKKHWNTINLEGELEDDFIKELIDHSYDLVVKGMPKKTRESLNAD